LVIEGADISKEFLDDLFALASEHSINFTIKIKAGENPFVELIPVGPVELDYSKVVDEIIKFGTKNRQQIRRAENVANMPRIKEDSDQNLLFLKLGGALITDRTRPYTPRLSKIESIVQQIALALKQNPGLKLVVGHGSGSFGHTAASRYRTREGVDSASAWTGFAEVWYQASRLNRFIIDTFHAVGIPAVTVSPFATVSARHQKIENWNTVPLLSALSNGLLPIIHGDTIVDNVLGGTILSTEALFEYLTPILHPRRILLAGLEKGVWADFPLRTKLVAEITTEDRSYYGEMKLLDTFVGGMGSKVGTMLSLCSKNPGTSVLIFSGEDEGNILQALTEPDRLLGTLLKTPAIATAA